MPLYDASGRPLDPKNPAHIIGRAHTMQDYPPFERKEYEQLMSQLMPGLQAGVPNDMPMTITFAVLCRLARTLEQVFPAQAEQPALNPLIDLARLKEGYPPPLSETLARVAQNSAEESGV